MKALNTYHKNLGLSLKPDPRMKRAELNATLVTKCEASGVGAVCSISSHDTAHRGEHINH